MSGREAAGAPAAGREGADAPGAGREAAGAPAAGRFEGATVLVGVTGCIAAYKACDIVRAVQEEGGRAKVVMTAHACEFVGPTTFRALTREPVATGLFDDPSDPIHHISLAKECDVFVIAPCTANVVAKLAHGLADDLLTTTALATRAPIVVAPAMNSGMYENPATQDNLAALRARGVRVVEAGEGYLACGDTGRGRLAEVAVVVDAAARALDPAAFPPAAADALDAGEGAAAFPTAEGDAAAGGDAATAPLAAGGDAAIAPPAAEGDAAAGGDAAARDLAGLRVLVTAGPTVEPIDPVRFLSNRSSGKMGYAVAAEAAARGAEVALVSGPVAIAPPDGVRIEFVETARDMLEAARPAFEDCDIAVFAAAVADVRPARPSARKLKKGVDDEALARIDLAENPDVLATCAAAKRPGQVVVGFAAETDDLLANARAKLASKGADLIVANDVAEGAVFGSNSNRATIVTAAGERPLPELSKREVARAVLDAALRERGFRGAGGPAAL